MALGLDRPDSMNSGVHNAREKYMFRYEPANVSERMPRHERAKVLNYEDYRTYMKDESRIGKDVRESQDKIEKLNE